jgi:serine protease
MVRLGEGVAPDWTALAPRFSSALGVAVTPQRQIGNVWVLELDRAQTPDQLTALAEALQQDAAVQYADPVLRKHPFAGPVPNDPRFAEQWGLNDSVSGIDAQTAWGFGSTLPPVTVAVVDTGILPHPDLEGRVLPGFDFISDAGRARDGDVRDSNPRDEGDWVDEGDCGGAPSEPSFWHGTFIAGQIAANRNNGIGIAGIASNAQIVPVRVLGKCGGTDEDVYEGVLWAAGARIDGVPPNANPAKIINMSLGGFGGCTQAIQEAIDEAMAQGAIVVAAAGNFAMDVSFFNPANCSGVITVGAHNRAGLRAAYSNFGTRIDLSAPSGDGGLDDSTLSTGNDGTTVPGNPDYVSGVGTSFAAPVISGIAALMLAKNSVLTPGRVLSLVQGSSRNFPPGSTCGVGNVCGSGLVDAGVAFASTPPSTDSAPAGTVPVIEYYHSALDQYFMTADANEAAIIDTYLGAFYQRTGNVFFAWNDPALAPVGAVPVCRFFGRSNELAGSHFFTAIASECQFVAANAPATWQLETGAAFWTLLADGNGTCPAGMVPVYRFSNNRAAFNQRFTADLSARRAMLNRAWALDGYAANGVAFCSAI